MMPSLRALPGMGDDLGFESGGHERRDVFHALPVMLTNAPLASTAGCGRAARWATKQHAGTNAAKLCDLQSTQTHLKRRRQGCEVGGSKRRAIAAASALPFSHRCQCSAS